MSNPQSASKKAAFGLIGLGVMGRALALNVEEHGFSVALWNREPLALERLLRATPGAHFTGAATLRDLVAALERPRRVMLMITAGQAVDATLDALRPFLEPGDIIVDGGNSWFKDTARRQESLHRDGLHFVGCGVSGGEEGARHGPALMPGGRREAYEQLRDVFEAIAARTDSGPCVGWVGEAGAGHFVKMVHNGIEYGALQIIAEVYDLLGRVGGLSAGRLAEVFSDWNDGPLGSFLVELAARVLGVVDPETSRPLVDLVLDRAGQKGTGKWTVAEALELAVPVPTLAAAVDLRVLSSLAAERAALAPRLAGPRCSEARPPVTELVAAARDALDASTICAYAQGLRLIAAGAEAHGWTVSLREVARIWRGGCILRAKLLEPIMAAYERDPMLPSLLHDEGFGGRLGQAQEGWRRAVGLAQAAGVPVAALASGLAYYDACRAGRLPLNLTQAQRDAFGAHTYERVDRPGGGQVHTDWLAGPMVTSE